MAGSTRRAEVPDAGQPTDRSLENAENCASLFYDKWRADRVFVLTPGGALVAQYMKTLMEFPPRQSPESWSPGAVMEKLRRHQELLESGSGAGVK